MFFDPQYVATVLGENLRDAQALFIEPLISIHYAHLVMLADCDILTRDDARTLRDGLDALSIPNLRQASFDGVGERLAHQHTAVGGLISPAVKAASYLRLSDSPSTSGRTTISSLHEEVA